MIFNILSGNTNDHARNHAVCWDGKMLSLTPAYDICPQGCTGNEVSKAMHIAVSNKMSQLATCLQTVHNFLFFFLPQKSSALYSILQHFA
ncbi:HipA domain-containing protein [Gynuella sunshinyii]|uniref:HipA domain-containing protein n=1 Tax=Gynuella sunshinyii TaxID=1445505 RepID=UPI00069B6464